MQQKNNQVITSWKGKSSIGSRNLHCMWGHTVKSDLAEVWWGYISVLLKAQIKTTTGIDR